MTKESIRFIWKLGTGKHFEAFISFVNQNQWLPQLFAAFMFFWLTAFVIGFGQLVLGRICLILFLHENFLLMFSWCLCTLLLGPKTTWLSLFLITSIDCSCVFLAFWYIGFRFIDNCDCQADSSSSRIYTKESREENG